MISLIKDLYLLQQLSPARYSNMML